jgi:hypothetical protein
MSGYVTLGYVRLWLFRLDQVMSGYFMLGQVMSG